MMKYEVKADRDITVAGLGVFEKGKPVELTKEMQDSFETIAGLPLHDDNLPEGVTVTKVEVKKTEGDK
jgi:hypothetical protein